MSAIDRLSFNLYFRYLTASISIWFSPCMPDNTFFAFQVKFSLGSAIQAADLALKAVSMCTYLNVWPVDVLTLHVQVVNLILSDFDWDV